MRMNKSGLIRFTRSLDNDCLEDLHIVAEEEIQQRLDDDQEAKDMGLTRRERRWFWLDGGKK